MRNPFFYVFDAIAIALEWFIGHLIPMILLVIIGAVWLIPHMVEAATHGDYIPSDLTLWVSGGVGSFIAVNLFFWFKSHHKNGYTSPDEMHPDIFRAISALFVGSFVQMFVFVVMFKTIG